LISLARNVGRGCLEYAENVLALPVAIGVRLLAHVDPGRVLLRRVARLLLVLVAILLVVAGVLVPVRHYNLLVNPSII